MQSGIPKIFTPPDPSPTRLVFGGALLLVFLWIVSLAGYYFYNTANSPAIVDTPVSVPEPIPSETPPSASATIEPPAVVLEKEIVGTVDLLKLIDPERDSVSGTWTRTADGLVSDNHPNGRIQVPYEVPEEYDLTMTFDRASGNDEVALILNNKTGRQFRWVMGGWHNQIIGFDMIRGRFPRENPSGHVVETGVLLNHVRYKTLVQVRNIGVKAYLQGELISEYTTDFSDMKLWDRFALPDSRTLGIVSQLGVLTVREFVLTPVTGKGRSLIDARAEPGRSLPQKSNDQF